MRIETTFDENYAKYLEVKEYFKHHNRLSTNADLIVEEHNIQTIIKQIWPNINENSNKKYLRLFIAFSYVALSSISSITSREYLESMTVYKNELGIYHDISIFANHELYKKGLLYDKTIRNNAPSDLIPATNGLKIQDTIYYKGTEYIISIQSIETYRNSFFNIDYDIHLIFMASVLIPLGRAFSRAEKEKYVMWTSTNKSELLTNMFKSIEDRCETLNLSLLSIYDLNDLVYIIEKIVPSSNDIIAKVNIALMLNMSIDSIVNILLQDDTGISPVGIPDIIFTNF